MRHLHVKLATLVRSRRAFLVASAPRFARRTHIVTTNASLIVRFAVSRRRRRSRCLVHSASGCVRGTPRVARFNRHASQLTASSCRIQHIVRKVP